MRARKPQDMPPGVHTTLIKLQIDRDGRIHGAAVARSSGKPIVDAAALAAVRDASPGPTLPNIAPGTSISATLPVSFDNSRAAKPARSVKSICDGC
ncbi:TonB family protein [Methylobacterium gnaphalii]|uniref:TonB family protein n=1 Tax=Methylobacterium gnaphalii TaxID=1010610 RepID=UPI0035A22561